MPNTIKAKLKRFLLNSFPVLQRNN